MKGIIPVVGLGTRVLPLTKGFSKELLPIGNKKTGIKPVIHWILEDMINARIEETILVVSPEKKDITKYFKKDEFLKQKLHDKPELLKRVEEIEKLGEKIRFTVQEEPKGFGHAILQTEYFIDDSYFMCSVGDTIYSENIFEKMMKLHKEYKCSIIALETIPKEEAKKYGVVEAKELDDGIFEIENLVEKPKNPPSNKTITGAYILSSDIFDILKKQKYEKELGLTESIKELLNFEEIIGFEMYDSLLRFM